MANLNWNNFKAKFDGKETSSFENLSYHLFCSEHNNEIGIFGFQNQTGIETEPLDVDGDKIGFQAKFYDTTLSSNKSDLIDSIRKAKRENKNLTVIYFYLNRSFSESTKQGKKDPQYKIDIENVAKEQKLKIEWRVPSHFERQLKLPKNKYLLDFYFSLGETIKNLIDGLIEHTEIVIFPIQSDIKFGTENIKIDRSKDLENLENKLADSNIIIISGDGGSGKTALLKDYYNKLNGSIPFYFFKAIEFEIDDVQQIFKKYGMFSLTDFNKIHEIEKEKVIVIDSAERISDIDNQEPIKEFITSLIKNKWTLIFTTRKSYLDDLRFQFIEIFKLPFESVSLENLSQEELQTLSKEFKFEVPENHRLKELIQNLFYLGEYLINYNSFDSKVEYQNFKELLWQKKIQNSVYKKNNIQIERENCFLDIIRKRSAEGGFFVNPKDCSQNILRLLEKDEIIGFDDVSGGYFITHDIYEEWGLNLIIDRAFSQFSNHNEFLEFIGTSLITRRAFRFWVSNMLIDDIHKIKPLIEAIIVSTTVEIFWKEEMLVSILLSEYSDEFFMQFEDKIIEGEYALLQRIIFLLRIACKEVDNEFYKRLGAETDLEIKYIFTKPKGNGWISVINLLYKYRNEFKIIDNPMIFPVLKDWNNHNKRGESTKKVSLMVLKAYEEITNNEEIRYSSNISDDYFKVIVEGALEIKSELEVVFKAVIDHNWVWPSNPYFDFCSYILQMNQDGIALIFAFPEYILKIANLYWFKSPPKGSFYSAGIGTEKYFGLSDNLKSDYSPASAYQTPFYWMLRFKFNITVDYVLEMTNKCIKHYQDSGFDQSIEEIEIIFDDGSKKKQLISNALWQMYRGTGSPVTPSLLQSIHMALEKVLLEFAKEKEVKFIEDWLLYLLKKSDSTSITSVVTSVVLAFPDKLFNVAKVLFSCKELFHYDNYRAVSEYQAKSLYSIGYGLITENVIYEDERIKTCEDSHRQNTLERLVLSYQLIKNKGISDDEFEKRVKIIWNLIDNFYGELPEKDKETQENKTTRLLLARLDKRQMGISTEEQGDKILITFTPKIDEELKKHSEDSVAESLSVMKYSNLKMWAVFKLEGNDKQNQYEEYQIDHRNVLDKTKEIISGLENNDNQFHLFNSSIPSLSCSTLIRFYSDKLTKKEKEFCKKTILEYATAPFHEGYSYQVSDGVEEAISSIPYLIKLFPEEVVDLNSILFLILINNRPLTNSESIWNFSIKALTEHLWEISPSNALKILLSFIRFKPLFNSIKKEKTHKEDMSFGRVRVSFQEVAQEFLNQYEKELEECLSKDFEIEEFIIDNYSLEDLGVIFQLIPVKTKDEALLKYVYEILTFLSPKLLKENRPRDRDPHRNRNEDMNHTFRYKFLFKYSYFILYRPLIDIKKFIKPFVDNFQTTEEMALFFEQIIWAEDKINQYEQFWIVWNQFYDKIVELGKRKSGHYSSNIIRTYLLAWNNWRDTAKDWRSLKDKERMFYKNVVRDIGDNPAVLDSISQFLNQIGSGFLDEGVFWVSQLVRKNENNDLGVNTVYYTALLIRKYIYLNRTKVKYDVKIKTEILVILNFLISKGSVNAYLLREDIL